MFELLANRDTAELIYFWSGTLLPIITIGAIFFTAIQVNYAKKQLQITAQQAQATLLLDLVEKWNSRNMHESRVAFDQIELEAKTKVGHLQKPRRIGRDVIHCRMARRGSYGERNAGVFRR